MKKALILAMLALSLSGCSILPLVIDAIEPEPNLNTMNCDLYDTCPTGAPSPDSESNSAPDHTNCDLYDTCPDELALGR